MRRISLNKEFLDSELFKVMAPDSLLGQKDLAKLFRVGKNTILDWRKKEILPLPTKSRDLVAKAKFSCRKNGSIPYWKKRDILTWIEENPDLFNTE